MGFGDRAWRLVATMVGLTVPIWFVKLVGVGTLERQMSMAVLLYFIGYMAMGLFGRQRLRPVPNARIIAIVPSYNETPEILERTVRSLLAGTLVPSVIHVVDDGSATPVVGFEHPRVVWHRKDNGGKHSAQARALRYEWARRPFDLVVTVDSDSVVDRRAVERCVREFSDPSVNAVTGVVHALNHGKNIITRLTDLHYVHSCVMVRCGLSKAGDVFTTSGALAVYRASMWMANLDDYVSRKLADDRHLTHLAQRTGRSVAVANAYVDTVVPDNIPDLMRQRIRWSRDYYRCIILDIKYLGGWSFWMRSADLVLMTIAPFFALAAFMVFPSAQWRIPWTGIGLWVAFLYVQTSCYLVSRRGIPIWSRLLRWLTLTPALFAFQMVIVGPAMVLSLVNLKHPSWQTRNVKPKPKPEAIPVRPASGHATPPVPSVPSVRGSGRNAWFDCLRVIAIGRVMLFHMTGLLWLGWIFPSMGVMFGIAGSLMVNSLDRTGDRPELMIWGRIRRLVPSVWMLAAVLVPTMLYVGWSDLDARPFNEAAIVAWILPLSDPPGNDWAGPITGTLWYIRTYLWLVLLSVPLYSGFKRFPKTMCAIPLALVFAGPMFHWNAWFSDVLTGLGTYTSCWMLGYAHRTGLLRRVSITSIVAMAVVAFGLGAAWMRMYPTAGYSIQENALAQAMWCIGFALLLLRLEPSMMWLSRPVVRPLKTFVDAVNSRAVTIYLWHQFAIVLCLPILDWMHIWDMRNTTMENLAKATVVVALVWLACSTVGRVEDFGSRRRKGPARPDSAASSDGAASSENPVSMVSTTVELKELRNLRIETRNGPSLATGRYRPGEAADPELVNVGRHWRQGN